MSNTHTVLLVARLMPLPSYIANLYAYIPHVCMSGIFICGVYVQFCGHIFFFWNIYAKMLSPHILFAFWLCELYLQSDTHIWITLKGSHFLVVVGVFSHCSQCCMLTC